MLTYHPSEASRMIRYLLRKLLIYGLTFVAAVTIDWSIPHLMPGNPVLTLMGRIQIQDPKVAQHVYDNYMRSFNLDLPLWKQYWYFWVSLFHGDLGTSILQFPLAGVVDHLPRDPLHARTAHPGDPARAGGSGNKLGALAARRKVLDNTLLPAGYMLTATPYMWLAIVLVWVFAITLAWFPVGLAYSPTAGRGWSMAFIFDLAHHWVLPFLSLFLVACGGWAIGMRNMIIYELESDYAHYLEALGAPRRLVRKYAFHNAMLPQISGLALSLGAVIAGALVDGDRLLVPGPRLPDLPRDHERGLLRDPGHLPVHHRRRPRRQLHRRHRLRDRRSEDADRDAGRAGMTHREAAAAEVARDGEDPGGAGAGRPGHVRASARRCTSRCGTRSSCSASASRLGLLLFAILGPFLAQHPPLEFGGNLSAAPTTKDGYWFGTTLLGQDVYAQFAQGLRLAFIVGALGGGIAAIIGMVVGFTAGYKGGMVDEVLNMITNVVLVIPTFAVLLVIAVLPAGARDRDGGGLHRAHVMAVGRARSALADLLAHVARVRQPGAAER